ncbi:P-loop NTPase fold protein [Streptomyces sp. NPDC127097]|uniref:P-loop NTPase fold protein n=1 Tax=Streptomyces sp. NPDC127097 TaxID=3347136 RepID=UPI00364D50D4
MPASAPLPRPHPPQPPHRPRPLPPSPRPAARSRCSTTSRWPSPARICSAPAAPPAGSLAGLLVASRAATPFTLAVDAGWGMGKSSLMRLVDAELAQAPEVHTVWYNAWTSTGADALEGLIKSVLMRFDRRVLRRGLQRISERGALLRAVRAMTTVAAGPLGVTGLVDELWRGSSAIRTTAPAARKALTSDSLFRGWSSTHRMCTPCSTAPSVSGKPLGWPGSWGLI